MLAADRTAPYMWNAYEISHKCKFQWHSKHF